MKKRLISLVLSILMVSSFMPVTALAAQEQVLYLNFGDSIAWGCIENGERYPEYNLENNSYSGLFASSFGTTRTSYARPGMQTTDVLYMIDDDFRRDVDNRDVIVDTWHWQEYPPYDGTSLEHIKSDISNADYISLCVGICDYVNYPTDKKDARMEILGNVDEASDHIKALLSEGVITDEIFCDYIKLLNMHSDKSIILLNYVLDIIDGYVDYMQYYGRIVRDLRTANPDGTIMLIGNYIPNDTIPVLKETSETSPFIFLINRLLDNMNLIAKKAAAQYDCLYVDTMGIDSNWHPTVLGHEQICDRMISVLEGNRTYAGGVDMIAPFCSQIEAADKLIAPFTEITKSAVSISKMQATLLLKYKYRNVGTIK